VCIVTTQDIRNTQNTTESTEVGVLVVHCSLTIDIVYLFHPRTGRKRSERK
jgi:hypothetical protein